MPRRTIDLSVGLTVPSHRMIDDAKRASSLSERGQWESIYACTDQRGSQDITYNRLWKLCQFLIITILFVIYPVSDFLFEVYESAGDSVFDSLSRNTQPSGTVLTLSA